MGDFINFLGNNLADFWTYTGFANATVGHVVMILVGLGFIYLAVAKEFEPMLLIPIGFGMLIGNIPFNMDAGLKVGIYEEGSVLNILYQGVTSGWYPPLIFLGIGAMTDFSALISNPKLMLIGAAAQFGIFGAYMIALEMGFDPMQAGAIGIIGGADGAVKEAIYLAGIAGKVTIVCVEDELVCIQEFKDKVAAYHNIEIMPHSSLTAVYGNERAEELEFTDNKTGKKQIIKDAECGVFVYAGIVPNTQIYTELKLDNGYIPVDELMQTEIPGVFAAGDICVKKVRQVATAVADGAIAGIQAAAVC